MIRRAALAAVLAVFGMAGAANAQVIVPSGVVLGYDPDLSAFLLNNTSAEILFDGYQIESETGRLDPGGWNSIQDQVLSSPSEVAANLGTGGFGFLEANPQAISLAEVNLVGTGRLMAGQKFHLGKPFGEGGYWVTFYSKTAGGGLTQQLYIQPVPEPCSLFLATVAGLGLVAMRSRGALSGARRSQQK